MDFLVEFSPTNALYKVVNNIVISNIVINNMLIALIRSNSTQKPIFIKINPDIMRAL